MRRSAAVKARQRKLKEESENQEETSADTGTPGSEENTTKAANKKGGSTRKTSLSKRKETEAESEDLSADHKENEDVEDDTDEFQEQYEVEKVVDMKVARGVKKYRIRWKGYNADSDTWETEDNLNCPEAIKQYLEQHMVKTEPPSVAKSGRKRVSRVAVDSEEVTSNDKQGTESDTPPEDKETEMPPAKKKKSTKKTKSDKKETDAAEVEEEAEEKAIEEPVKKEEIVKNVKAKSKGKKAEAADDEETENGINTDETSYEVEKIMEVHHKKNGKKEYLIHWRGYPHSQDTWEPEENLDCEELIREFEEKVKKAKNLSVRELRTERVHTSRYSEEQPGKRHSKRGKGKKRATYYDNE